VLTGNKYTIITDFVEVNQKIIYPLQQVSLFFQHIAQSLLAKHSPDLISFS
jgi:hypothetical protein